MDKIIKKFLWICFIGLTAAFLCILFLFYSHWIAGNYRTKFADVLNSHDMKQYDKFFDDDTVFELNGKKITYAEARESMEKTQKFSSVGSYGSLPEDLNEYFKKEYEVGLMLPISEYDNGNDIVTVGGLEGEIILERKWIFFFHMKKVEFYYDNEGFLEDFLGLK